MLKRPPLSTFFCSQDKAPPTLQDEDIIYMIRLECENPSCVSVITHRNSSNGYYGNDISRTENAIIRLNTSVKFTEIFGDTVLSYKGV